MDVHQVVNVNKDGSGTVVETMVINMPPELAALAGDQDPIADLMKKANQDKRAKDMNATYVDSEKFAPKGGGKGLKSTFKFDDISKLKLNADGGLSNMNPDPTAEKPGDDQAIKFGFTKGATSKLTIKTPPMNSPGDDDEKIDPQQFAMMSQFMKGMRVRLTVKPDGKITKTDATHNDDGVITLVDMEMDKLLADQKKFEAFTKLSKEQDRKKVASKLKELDIKAEAKEEISVEFK